MRTDQNAARARRRASFFYLKISDAHGRTFHHAGVAAPPGTRPEPPFPKTAERNSGPKLVFIEVLHGEHCPHSGTAIITSFGQV